MERELPPDSSASTSRPKPLDWPQLAGKSEPVARAIELYVRRQRRRRAAAVASALAVVLAASLAWRNGWMRDDASFAPALAATSAVAPQPATVVSLPDRQMLPDGSLVEMKPGAEIAVDFVADAPGPRRVRLVRGEAHFTVVKNAERPFVVAAGGVEVRAVGTAFSVQWGGSDVEVLVTAGRVAVDKSMPPPAVAATAQNDVDLAPVANGRKGLETGASELPAPLAFVDAGNRAVVATTAGVAMTPRVEAVTKTELSERLAWRVPRLEFSATPLVEVIALFNRHAVPQDGAPTTRLTLADPELGALPLSGMLRVDNVAVLLQIMESSYGIAAERHTDGAIVLRRGR